MLLPLAVALSNIFTFITFTTSQQCGSNVATNRINFSYLKRLRIYKNTTYSTITYIFCSSTKTYGRHPLHHGIIPDIDYVIGFYRIRSNESHLCYAKNDAHDVRSMTGGVFYTMGN